MVDRLSSDDKVMLWPEAQWPQHVSALLVLDGSPAIIEDGNLRIDAVRRHVGLRLDRVPRLRQRLVVPHPGLGGPYWVDDECFDLDRHVGVVGVPPPGDDAALLEVVEHLRRRPLDRSRPLWDMCVLTGLAHGRVGLLARVHHVVADGVAGVATLSAFLDAEPCEVAPQADVRPWRPEPPPSQATLVSDAMSRCVAATGRLVRSRGAAPPMRPSADAVHPFRRLLTGPHPPRTSLDRMVGPDRSMAVLRAPLAPIHEVGRAHGATVNDVLLTATAGGIRSLLLHRGEPTPRLPCYVPATLRPQDDREQARGNLIAQLVVPLPLDVEDPVARLLEIARLSAAARQAAHPRLGALVGNRLSRWLLLALLQRNPVSVTTADVVGPREPRWFANARVIDVFPLLPLVGSVTVGFGALSYAGRLGIMLVADADACPDLDVCIAGVHRDLDLLAPVHR